MAVPQSLTSAALVHPAAAVAVVAVGGAVGATARWGLLQAWPTDSGGFLWSTFVTNLMGSTLLARLPAIAVVRMHPLLPPMLGTGGSG